MKRIGIIGGVGPSTTATFYMRVIQLEKELHNARPLLLIHSVPVPAEMEDHFLRTGKGIKDYIPFLKTAGVSLMRAGAEIIVMPCNSLHHLRDEIRQEIHVPFMSIVDETVRHLQKVRVRRIGILGSPLTLQKSLYVRPLKRQGIECVVPSKNEQTVLGEIIRNIVFGEKKDSDEHRFMEVMNSLQRRGVKHLLLACTDLQELQSRHPLCTVHDTMDILAHAVCSTRTERSSNMQKFDYTDVIDYGQFDS